jgi:hypothetical protein
VIEPRSAKSVVATVGKPLKLSARLELDDGKLLPIDDEVTWTSANPSVLRVADVASPEPSGSVTPLRAGIAAVTITYPRVSDPSLPATSRLSAARWCAGEVRWVGAGDEPPAPRALGVRPTREPYRPSRRTPSGSP